MEASDAPPAPRLPPVGGWPKAIVLRLLALALAGVAVVNRSIAPWRTFKAGLAAWMTFERRGTHALILQPPLCS
jgi:hypothetical protein